MHPSHIVLAVSMFGDPNIPIIQGSEHFKGTIFHASQYPGGAPFAGKRVVVIGAGNTSADICQDLVYRGAQSVTMVQRSSTSVISAASAEVQDDKAFPEVVPTEYVDLSNAGLPYGAVKPLLRAMRPWREEFDKDLREGLVKAGFKLNDNDGFGQPAMVFERGGGKLSHLRSFLRFAQ